jgi:endoglucanase
VSSISFRTLSFSLQQHVTMEVVLGLLLLSGSIEATNLRRSLAHYCWSDEPCELGETCRQLPVLPWYECSPNLPLLRAQGQYWVQDHDGSQINLKGTNLGNWLLQEFWMMEQGKNGVFDQCTLESTLEQRFGSAEKDNLMKLFHDNWISERDWDILASFGFNVVRLPLLWSLMEDGNNPETIRPDAWEYIDWAISQAAERNMYTILDMHGVVGGQGVNDHTGCANQNEYWTNTAYQSRTIWLWEQIAEKYRGNSNVAAYGLLNEPWGSTSQNMATRMFELYDAVRAVDPDHVVIFSDHNRDNIQSYGNPATERNMSNFAFETHPYPGRYGVGNPENLAEFVIHRNWLKHGIQKWAQRMQDLGAPLLIGEFQVSSIGEIKAFAHCICG